MQELKKGKSFNINSIHFDNDSYELNDVAKEILIEFSKYLKLNNNLVIEINGFTDNVGEGKYNQLLSENRAKTVRDLILTQGIAEYRVFYNGFGEDHPVSDNDSEEGRAKNRRTEFKIIDQ